MKLNDFNGRMATYNDFGVLIPSYIINRVRHDRKPSPGFVYDFRRLEELYKSFFGSYWLLPNSTRNIEVPTQLAKALEEFERKRVIIHKSIDDEIVDFFIW